jgi:hypothetical protein
MLQLNWLAVVYWWVSFVYLLLFFGRCFSRVSFSYFVAINFRDGQDIVCLIPRRNLRKSQENCTEEWKIDNVNREMKTAVGENFASKAESKSDLQLSLERALGEFFPPRKNFIDQKRFHRCIFLPYAHFHCRLSLRNFRRFGGNENRRGILTTHVPKLSTFTRFPS